MKACINREKRGSKSRIAREKAEASCITVKSKQEVG